jgi:hypothetical protein
MSEQSVSGAGWASVRGALIRMLRRELDGITMASIASIASIETLAHE